MIDSGIDSVHAFFGDGPGFREWTCYAPVLIGDITGCFQPTGQGFGFHGSHVGGIAAARNQGAGYLGVAYNPDLFTSIRACTAYAQGAGCHEIAIVAALDWREGEPLHWGLLARRYELADVYHMDNGW